MGHSPGQSPRVREETVGPAEHPPLASPLPRFVALLCCANLDINELNLPKTCDISFSDPDDLLNFKLVICPDEVRTPPHHRTPQALAGPWPHLEGGDLVHLPGPAGWPSKAFLFSSLAGLLQEREVCVQF